MKETIFLQTESFEVLVGALLVFLPFFWGHAIFTLIRYGNHAELLNDNSKLSKFYFAGVAITAKGAMLLILYLLYAYRGQWSASILGYWYIFFLSLTTIIFSLIYYRRRGVITEVNEK